MLYRNLLSGLLIIWSLLIYSHPSSAATITSTTAGGPWYDTLTWVGHQVPGNNDDVIINSNVYNSTTDTCRSLRKQ